MHEIGSYTYDDYCKRVKAFHGTLAPGILVGGFMVDLARRNLPPGTLFDVICETVQCLPDAVQLLTPCSVGNQWMKIIDVGRFALTLYDKDTGEGVRVHMDSGKLERWPAIREWFFKLKPKREQDLGLLVEEIREAGADICGMDKITVLPGFLRGGREKSVTICPICGEAYRAGDGAVCPACSQGELLPYVEQAYCTEMAQPKGCGVGPANLAPGGRPSQSP